MRILRIALSGGGTGGHIFPIVAVARQLKALSPTVELRFIGSVRFGKEALLKENIEISPIVAGKLPRYFTPMLIVEFFKIPIGFVMALWRLFWYMPDIVFGKGGYGMLPVAVVAWLYRIPIVIHESDAIAGLATKLVSHMATVTLTSFPDTKGLNSERTLQVGNPIRETLIHGDRSRGQERFELALKPTVLILGGSQGAESLNNMFVKIAPELAAEAEIIHQVGDKNIELFTQEITQVLQPYPDAQRFYHAVGFMGEEALMDAYASATVAVARAGSGLIFELAALGIPTILLPLENSAGNHQYANAEALVNEEAVLMLAGTELTPNLLLDQIRWLLSDEAKRLQLSERFKAFARLDAAKIIASTILNVAETAITKSSNQA